MKYHVNPQTFKTSECKAKSRPCPFGGSEVYFNSKKEATDFVDEVYGTVKGAEQLLKEGVGWVSMSPYKPNVFKQVCSVFGFEVDKVDFSESSTKIYFQLL